MNEINFTKEVWTPADGPFKFQENVNPQTGEKKFIIEGIMLPFEKISRNGVLYNKRSVQSKCQNLVGRPLMYNHITEGDAKPLGHFVESWCDDKNWYYKADVDPQEKVYLNKLKRGDLRHVSIQLRPEKAIERLTEDNKSFIEAYVDDVIEGSIVPTPGFLDTTVMFAEAFKKEDINTTTGSGAMSPSKIVGKNKEEIENPLQKVDLKKYIDFKIIKTEKDYQMIFANDLYFIFKNEDLVWQSSDNYPNSAEDQWIQFMSHKESMDLIKNFPMDQFHKGLIHELEHADTVDNDIYTIAKITIDHLAEDPQYYDKLKDIEDEVNEMLEKVDKKELEDIFK